MQSLLDVARQTAAAQEAALAARVFPPVPAQPRQVALLTPAPRPSAVPAQGRQAVLLRPRPSVPPRAGPVGVLPRPVARAVPFSGTVARQLAPATCPKGFPPKARPTCPPRGPPADVYRRALQSAPWQVASKSKGHAPPQSKSKTQAAPVLAVALPGPTASEPADSAQPPPVEEEVPPESAAASPPSSPKPISEADYGGDEEEQRSPSAEPRAISIQRSPSPSPAPTVEVPATAYVRSGKGRGPPLTRSESRGRDPSGARPSARCVLVEAARVEAARVADKRRSATPPPASDRAQRRRGSSPCPTAPTWRREVASSPPPPAPLPPEPNQETPLCLWSRLQSRWVRTGWDPRDQAAEVDAPAPSPVRRQRAKPAAARGTTPIPAFIDIDADEPRRRRNTPSRKERKYLKHQQYRADRLAEGWTKTKTKWGRKKKRKSARRGQPRRTRKRSGTKPRSSGPHQARQPVHRRPFGPQEPSHQPWSQSLPTPSPLPSPRAHRAQATYLAVHLYLHQHQPLPHPQARRPWRYRTQPLRRARPAHSQPSCASRTSPTTRSSGPTQEVFAKASAAPVPAMGESGSLR